MMLPGVVVADPLHQPGSVTRIIDTGRHARANYKFRLDLTQRQKSAGSQSWPPAAWMAVRTPATLCAGRLSITTIWLGRRVGTSICST